MPDGGNSFRHKLFVFTAAIFTAVCILFFFMPAVRQFLLIDYKTDEVLYLTNVNPGDKFSITYVHSVNRSPIEDRYYINENYDILIYKTIFKSFGAGVPSNSDDGGKFEYFNNRIEVTDINRKIDKLLMFVGVIADHHFLINGKDIKLNELTSPQKSIHFAIKKITVYQYLKYMFKKRVGIR